MANNYETGSTLYTPRQRAVSLTLGVACSIPLTSTMAMANAPMPHLSAVNPHGPAMAASHAPVGSFAHAAAIVNHPAANFGSLNLMSALTPYLANNLANFTNLTIMEGGRQEQVNLSSKLTAAEVVAVQQVLAGGASGQTIKLSANGTAVGGTVSLTSALFNSLNSSMGGSINSMYVPRHVQIIDSVGNLSLSGNLINLGQISTASGSAGNSDIISANNIVNASGASIGSYTGGNGMYAANPVLNATTALINYGTISSAGNLTINAPVVTNAAAQGGAGSISAANNVNINTSTLNNAGMIAALNGNVNVMSAGALAFNGAGGTVQANNGDINMASTDADLNAFGGNLLSQQVNLSAGSGNVLGQVGEVTGEVNASASCVHFGADTANLNLGVITATGDPTITSTGDLTITSLSPGASNGAPITLIAGANIISNGGALDTTQAAKAGGNLNLIAGAAFTPFTSGNQAATVTKGSSTGGVIDLTGGHGGGGAITGITTQGAAGLQSGDIQMIAFGGSVAGSGSVLVPSGVTVNAGGGGSLPGNVTIIAGAKTGAAISTDSIVGNNLTVGMAAPVVSKTGVVFDASGNQTSGTFTASATGNATTGNLGNVNAAGTMTVVSGGSLALNNTGASLTVGNSTVGKTGSLVIGDTAANSSLVISGVVTGGSSSFTSTGTGSITTSGTGSINTTSTALNGGSGGAKVATNTGTLTLNEGGDTFITQGTATLGFGGSVTGGSKLDITSNGQVNLNSALNMPGGAGSTLNITTSSTDKGGIRISAPAFLGTGSITLTNLGKGLITEGVGQVLGAQNVTLVSAQTSIGSKSTPFQTNSKNLDVELSGTKNSAYISDQNVGPVTFTGNVVPATGVGGSLFLTSTSSLLSVANANFNNVSITDTLNSAGSGIVNFGTGGAILGTNAGTFTVVSVGGIQDSKSVTLNGTTITLTTTGVGADIGKSAAPIFVASPNLVLNSAQGSVFVTDSLAATVNGSASLKGTFSVTDTGAPPSSKVPASLTVGKSVAGGDIILKTAGAGTNIALNGTTGTATTNSVTIGSAAGLTTKGAVNGGIIAFATNGVVTFGGSVGNSSSTLTFNNTGTSPITLGGILTGNNIKFTSAGPINITKAITGTGPGSKVSISGTAAKSTDNAVTIGAAITGGTINVDAGGTGSIAINAAVGNSATADTTISAGNTGAGGSVLGSGLVSGTVVTLNALGTSGSIGSSAKPINTAAGTLSPNVGGTGPNDGAFVTQKGNMTLGSSTDVNLVVKATGSLDVAAGAVLTATNLSLTSSGPTTIDGIVTNGGNPGTFTINSGGNFTISSSGALLTTNEKNPVTVNVTGTTTIAGNTNVQTLNLKTSNGMNITGTVGDGTDNFNITGPLVIDGQLGNSNGNTVLNVTTNSSVVIGQNSPSATIIGGAGSKVSGASIINYVTLNGSVNLVGTGAGNAFQNFGTITGLNVGVTTTNPAGVIFNAPGAVIKASQSALSGGSPTITLNTYGVDNEGLISAVGQVSGAQGILNIVSPGALTITGRNDGFEVGNFNAVNLVAKGNVTVGGVVNGVPSSPFNNFTDVNHLGTFTVDTTGSFSSSMPGVSVLSNSTGTFGGNISIKATNILFNGVGTAPVFFMNATGAGPTVSTGSAPLTLILTAPVTFGSAPGNFSANIQGFGNASTTTVQTTNSLTVNTAQFNVHKTSLFLEGDQRILISGDLNEGVQTGTQVHLKTLSTTPFLIGGASATGNGMNNLTDGQGISADIVFIEAPGSVTIGSTTGTPVAAVITGKSSVTFNSQALTINKNSDVAGLGLTLNVFTGDTTYTNLNDLGAISASALNINDAGGIVHLSSGGTTRTNITVGTTPFGPGPGDLPNNKNLLSGGSIKINAEDITFSAQGLSFNATGGIDGGSVIINLSGVNGVANPFKIGSGAGQVSANIAAGQIGIIPNADPDGSGNFSVTVPADITALNLSTDIYMGPSGAGGRIDLVSLTGNVLVGGVSTNIYNLLGISSNSANPLLATGATVNGIKDKNAVINGGNFALNNFGGDVVTNGVQYSGTELDLSAAGKLDLSGNNSPGLMFTVSRSNLVGGGTDGGIANLSGGTIFVGTTGKSGDPNFVLTVEGGSNSPANVTVTTTTSPIAIGSGNGQLKIDVSQMDSFNSGPKLSAKVFINSQGTGTLQVDGTGVVFGGAGNLGEQGVLNLASGFGQSPSGNNIAVTNADLFQGLNFSTLLIQDIVQGKFVFGGIGPNGNGFSYSSAASNLTVGSLIVDAFAQGASIDTTGAQLFAHNLTLNTNTINFAATTLTLQPDLVTGVGVSSQKSTGNGGTFDFNASKYTFSGPGAQFIAQGNGMAGSTGGSFNVNSSQTTTLKIDSTTFSKVDVSNGNPEKAGSVTINNLGDMTVDASVFAYGSTGGSLSLTAPNVAISNINSLTAAKQDSTGGLGLASISFNTTSTADFKLSNAGSNGITDAANTVLVAGSILITNNGVGGKGGIDFTGGDKISGATISVSTPNTVTFASGQSITAAQLLPVTDPNVGQGGSILIQAGTIAITGSSGAVSLNATGNTGATGTGGTVNLSVNGVPQIVVGKVTGGFAIDVSNAGAGKAGQVTISNNAGDVSVDASALTFGPTVADGSGSLSVTGNNVLINGVASLNLHPLASIQLRSTSASDFEFGGATVNGFQDTGLNTLNVKSLTITNNLTGALTGGIDMVGNGVGNTLTAKVNTLTLATQNTVTLNSGTTINLVADVTSGAGGTLGITAGNIAYSVPGTGVKVLANGVSPGSGGNVSITQTGGSPLVIGAGGLSISVTGGGTANAGVISLKNSGEIDVDCSALTFGPAVSPGGSGSLSIDGTNLLISKVASLTPDLTSILLTSASASDFKFGGATVNGITDAAATLKAVSLAVNVNSGGGPAGGIDATGGVTISTHNLTLNTANTVTLPGGGNFTQLANPVTGDAGTIQITAGALVVTTKAGFAFNATGLGGKTAGAGGSVTLTIGSVNGLTIGSTGLSFNVTNVAGQAGGTVSVTTGGRLDVDGNSITVGKTFPAGQGPNVTLAANGVLAINNVGHFDPAGLNKLTLSSDDVSDFVLGKAAAGANGIQDSGATIAADQILITSTGGAITNGSLASLNGASVVTLSASTGIGATGVGNAIQLGGAADATKFSTVSLTAGGDTFIDSQTTGKSLYTGALVIGDLVINHTNGDAQIGSDTAGFLADSVTFNYTNASLANTNTVSVQFLQTQAGNITVTSNAQNMVVGNPAGPVTLQTQAGDIILNNTNLTAGSNISIADYTVIHGVGLLPVLTTGNVTVAMGSVPFSHVSTTSSIEAFIVESGPNGNVTFGDTAGKTVTFTPFHAPFFFTAYLQGLDRFIAFNTSTLPSTAITIGDQVFITADPPAISASAGATQAGAMHFNAAPAPMVMPASINSSGTAFGTMPVSVVNGAPVTTSATVQSGLQVSAPVMEPITNVSLPLSSYAAASQSLIPANVNVVSSDLASLLNTGSSAALISNEGISAASVGSFENTGSQIAVTSGTNVAAGASSSKTLKGEVSTTEHRTIESGPMLVLAERNQVLDTPHGTVKVAAGSVVLLVSTPEGLAVYNLHDSHKDAVTIQSGTRKISVMPGRSAVIAKSSSAFETVNPAPFVGYRGLVSREIEGAKKLHEADFNVLMMINGLQGLRQLISSESATTRRTMGNVIKTAAIMMQLSNSAKPYALYLPPKLTAYASELHK